MNCGREGTIRAAIVGIGNCASSLVQGVSYCRREGENAIGVSIPDLCGYGPGDIDFVAAFDVDERKVGCPLSEAVLAQPNCTTVFCDDLSEHEAVVIRGPDLDGVSAFMRNQGATSSIQPSSLPALSRSEVVAALRASRAEVMVIFLPVGSHEAVEFYVSCALEAGCAVVNGIPVFVASNQAWAQRFRDAGLPILGDDFKAQFGATILHRALVSLADIRGVQIDRTYQLNVGGNSDFLNMTDYDRVATKRESKTEAVQSAMDEDLTGDNIRIGPSDYVPWLNDRKVAYIRLEGRLFGGVPTSTEVRLEVEDSPNAAAEAILAIRCARVALDRGLGGPVTAACAFLFKHPPEQMSDTVAYRELLAFANGGGSAD